MAYINYNGKILKYGNKISNSGESFVLKATGSTFPSSIFPSGQLIFRFLSIEPVDVNYGDGSVIRYIPSSIGGGLYQLTFNIGVNLYTYADGQNIARNVSFSFNRSKLTYLQLTNQKLQIADFLFEFSKYPALTHFELVNESYILNLNAESIVGSNVTEFLIANAFVSSSRLYYIIPIQLFSTPLVNLSIGTQGIHTKTFAESNLDKMTMLATTLQILQIYGSFEDDNFGYGALPSNYNLLINLKELHLQATKYTTTPVVINEIISLKYLTIYGSPFYTSYGNISALVNLENIRFTGNTSQPDTIPSYFSAFTKLKTMQYISCFTTQARMDNFVDNVYSFVVTNAPITGTFASQFRSMSFSLGTSGSIVTPPPSGIYQQPSGYIQGSNNGSPASQKEKIWVMVSQYSHTWTTN